MVVVAVIDWVFSTVFKSFFVQKEAAADVLFFYALYLNLFLHKLVGIVTLVAPDWQFVTFSSSSFLVVKNVQTRKFIHKEKKGQIIVTVDDDDEMSAQFYVLLGASLFGWPTSGDGPSWVSCRSFLSTGDSLRCTLVQSPICLFIEDTTKDCRAFWPKSKSFGLLYFKHNPL